MNPSGRTPSTRSLPLLEGPEELRRRTWQQLVSTFHRVERGVVEMLSKHEMTIAQFDVLANLRFGEGVTQQELATRLLVTKGNVCGLLDRLERLGWVERRADQHDARANRLHLTVAGRKKIDVVLPDHDAYIFSLLGPMSDNNIKALRQSLRQLEQATMA